MNPRILLALSSVPACCLAAEPTPAPSSRGVLVYAVGGTGGIGGGLGLRLNDTFTLRAEVADFKYDTGRTESGIHYEAGVKLATQALFLDYKPFAGSFRLTAGVNFSNHSIGTLTAYGANVEVGGNTYNLNADPLRASIDFDTRPYLGIGWGLAKDGLTMGLDLGVEIGAPAVSMSGAGILPADLEQERAELDDAVSDYTVYPIVKLSVGYSF